MLRYLDELLCRLLSDIPIRRGTEGGHGLDGIGGIVRPSGVTVLADLKLPEPDSREKGTHRPGEAGEMAVQIASVVQPCRASNLRGKDI